MDIQKHYFISYSREDIAIARSIRKDLKKHDIEVWVDKDDIPLGTRWDDFIEKNIEQSIAVLYLVSPDSRSSAYVLHELELAKKYKKTIFPLWVKGDTEEWSSYVHFGLSSLQYIDLRGETYTPGIAELVQTLLTQTLEEVPIRTRKTEPLQPSTLLSRTIHYLEKFADNVFTKSPNGEKRNPSPASPPSDSSRNPYKGLHAFEYEDAWSFCGRENQVCEMVQHVEDILNEEHQDSRVARCMMVKGASGSGKSSLVIAGLLPALERRVYNPETKVSRWFFLAPVRPGEHPMNALAQILNLPFLNREKVGDSPLEIASLADLRKTLNEPRGLDKLLRKITYAPGERVVLIIDQFEEIFAPTVHPEQRDQFINLLMETATAPDTLLLLLFTLRVDFYDRILNNATLYKNVKRHQIDIPNMTPEELRLIIEKPAQHPDVDVVFDPNLAEELLHEIRERPEALPLLQFTLDQLFKLREGRRLTQQSYDEMGKLRGAINKHADDIYNHELHTFEHRAEAERLFTEYFIYVAEAHGEPSHLETGEGITRRRVTRAELRLDDPQFITRRETIDAFVDARLLTTTSVVRQNTDSKQENVTEIAYEISHEALINAWEKFREWIKKNRKDIYLMQSLRPRIKEWGEEKNPKKKKGLLVEKLVLQQLQEYSKRKKLDPLADTFLEASLTQQKHQYVRRYLFATALIILSLVLGLFIRNVLFPDPTIVTSLADSGPGTLPYALQTASDGATITFDASLRGKTIYLTHSSLEINKSITLRGPADRINISSSNTGNNIYIAANKNVLIENITFANSYTQKNSMIKNEGNLTINNSRINENKSHGYGGVIYNTGNLILNNDTIEKNKVSTDGGAIHNLFGTVSINNSTINGNEAYGNGGGIFSQGGAVTVSSSHILSNSADNNVGGGIDMVNGVLSMSDTQIYQNHSDYVSASISAGYGGGIAIVGSVAFITSSVITANTASAKGGGIAVTDDIGNNSSSLVKLQDIILINDPSAVHYIGQNTGGDIAGNVTPTGTTLQILDDRSIDNLGNPPGSPSPQNLPNYIGNVNINTFCLRHGGSYGKISTNVDRTAPDIMFTCFNQSNKPVGSDSPGQAICQFQYSASSGVNAVIDRMANYFDPTSLECYKNLKRLGPIGQVGFANYCASQPQYTGLFDNSQYRSTAYDWLCQPKDQTKLPNGLSVADACNLQYNVKNAIYRLTNFNSINGWECWEPA